MWGVVRKSKKESIGRNMDSGVASFDTAQVLRFAADCILFLEIDRLV